ncbi:MAG: tRNA preQ1(34) S-adenosylmethionine ribosyltransferase-isomerase QueA [Anaerolineae bacterium]|nr:tRNA preQ1(34) S-adenosylmethionine ribosyltransferase-isomerase QueA [Anaerolineae bacterium]
MLTSAFDYDLPEELIAQHPAVPRDTSRLLVIDRATGTLCHQRFTDILSYLRPGDVLVVNETRVIPARVQARKVPTGGKVELLLLSRHAPLRWEALVKGRPVRVGQRLAIGQAKGQTVGAVVTAITPSGGRLLHLEEPIDDHLDQLGTTPLPPYIHANLDDPSRYQTVYARVKGSVAAPTAGLHWTPELIERATERGLQWERVLLHIGLDTFRPVREERVEDHEIHTEYCRLDDATAQRLNRARAEGRRIVAVGTTSVRVLESAARGPSGSLQPLDGPTALFIRPGYTFRAVDALLTNFHLPRSTLLMLVSAFAGMELIRRAYEEAVRQRYRFYSFGDAMLII